jgi:hypothetical protein
MKRHLLLQLACGFVTVALLAIGSNVLAADSSEELAKKTQNPVADLISLPLQSNWDFDLGPKENKSSYTMNVQPVLPFSLNEEYNLITRTIIPIKKIELPESESGVGDINQSFFLSPKKPVNGWIIGGGPVFLYPTASDELLGGEKWAAGPTAVFLKQEHGWTYGLLANHLWSFAGDNDREDISSTFLQPFLTYTTKTYTTPGINTESTYDWEAEQWTVPINLTVTQLLKIGGHPISLQLGYRYYADAPKYGPDWGLRFALTFLFPK